MNLSLIRVSLYCTHVMSLIMKDDHIALPRYHRHNQCGLYRYLYRVVTFVRRCGAYPIVFFAESLLIEDIILACGRKCANKYNIVKISRLEVVLKHYQNYIIILTMLYFLALFQQYLILHFCLIIINCTGLHFIPLGQT